MDRPGGGDAPGSRPDPSGLKERTGRPDPSRRADAADLPAGPDGPDALTPPQEPARRELQEGYGRADEPRPPERLKRSGRLERPTRPVRTERPLRPPRRSLPEPLEPPAPQPRHLLEPPELPEPYERPEFSGIPAQQRPELPEPREEPVPPAVPARRTPGASPARITARDARPAVPEPGGEPAEPVEPAAGAASLEPASRPPVVSRESTPPRRHPLAAPPQPPGRAGRAAEYVGERPPTYDAEPTAWPAADPQDLDGLVPDTVLDGAQYGAVTLRALSLRGDSPRYRGEPRRDALLTARFGEGEGALLLVAMASGPRGSDVAPRAARDACAWLAGAVGRSHARLADDIRGGRRGELKSGLHRLTDRSYGRLRARAAELGLRPDAYTATVRCLLLTADPQCRTRVFFGVGAGGLFRLRDGVWQDLEPDPPTERTGEPVIGYGSAPADLMTMDLGIPTPGLTPPVEPVEVEPPGEPFRFRASVARPGDTLMLCTAGLADPMRGEQELGGRLAERWAGERPPGLAAFLADTQLRVKGYADDRTACALWEA
ncbi:protein phosphatase 2C domain-containing protein [Streptomyces roseifaciens]